MRGCRATASSVIVHRFAAALEQPAAEPLLHLGDLRRQRRLADAGEFRGPAEMQRLRQRVEILHLPDGDPDHKASLSQRTAKAICLYDAGGLVWNHSRVARPSARLVVDGGPMRRSRCRSRPERRRNAAASTLQVIKVRYRRSNESYDRRTTWTQRQTTGAGKCPVRRRRAHAQEPRLVAEAARHRDAAPQFQPVRPDGRGLRLRRGIPEPRPGRRDRGPAAVMTDSQDWWPADFGHYGGLFVRMAWH